MSGGGGGSSGQVSYPEYLQTFHRNVLNHDGGTLITRSYADAHNTASGINPFDAESSYDPQDQVSLVEGLLTTVTNAINAFDGITSYQSAFAAALTLLTLDTSPLETAAVDTVTLDSVIATTVIPDSATPDSATVDTTTLSVATLSTPAIKVSYTPDTVPPQTFTPDETAINDSITAYAAILRDNIENDILPRYKAGMLNVNAITTSAFVIGEALIYAMYDRDVAKYAADLRAKSVSDANGYNAQLLIENERTNNQLRIAAFEANVRTDIAIRGEQQAYNLAKTDQDTRFKLANTSETTQLKITASEQNTRFKLAASEQNTRFKLSAGERNNQLAITASEQNARFKLSFQDSTVKLKIAASEQNARFKLQKNEIDGNFKINRWKNAIISAGEMSRLITSKIEFQRGLIDGSVKSNAFIVLARKEEMDENLKISEHAANWEIDLFQKAANLMASVSGGTAPSMKKQSQAVSALSGALSGAATGAAIGTAAAPGYGTAIGAAAGAIIGGIGGYLQ